MARRRLGIRTRELRHLMTGKRRTAVRATAQICRMALMGRMSFGMCGGGSPNLSVPGTVVLYGVVGDPF